MGRPRQSRALGSAWFKLGSPEPFVDPVSDECNRRVSDGLAIGSLRMTLWPTISDEQVDYVAAQVPPAVAQLRTHAISI